MEKSDGRRPAKTGNKPLPVSPKLKDIGIDAQTKVVRVADPIQYVLSLNLHRRHLTPSQLSMVAARVRAIYDKQAKERSE